MYIILCLNFNPCLHFRNQSEKNLKTNVVATVEGIKNQKPIKEPFPDDVSMEKAILSVGFNLIKVVKKMDVAFAPMITNTYLICMLLATGYLYLSSTALFFPGKHEVIWLSVGGLAVTWLAISRLYIQTKQGHLLSKFMKKCFHFIMQT